ncbi:MAG: flagellar hook-length control protein FliK [Firmicutes bacterium]|nr:flagellar hook-length control protein FliK [[Eubacterium] siraeum]MCM1486948.1 flagellar hook-length control protein FliK [Bacillota bacterium]
MTEIRVGSGLSMTASRSSSTDDLISSAGFMASLQQVSAAEIGTAPTVASDRSANSQQSVRSTDQTAASAQAAASSQPATDARTAANTQTAQDNPDAAANAAEQGYTADQPAQPVQEDKAQFDNLSGEDLKAALQAAMGTDVSGEKAALAEQAKKFLEALASDEDLQQTLKDMLTQALHKAFEELKDPDKREEEFTQKVLKFLEKFIEKMNGKEKKTALEEGNPDQSAEGLLMQMLQNMIRQMQGVQTKDTTVSGAQALESQAIAPVDAAAALNADMFEAPELPNQMAMPEEKTEDVPARTDSFVNNLENAEDMPKAAEENAAEAVRPAERAEYEQIAEKVYTQVADQFYQAVGDKAETVATVEEKATVTRVENRYSKKVRSSEEELEELKRLFGMEPKKREKIEKPEETEESEESGKGRQTDPGTNRKNTETVTEDTAKFSEKLGIETVAVTEKTEAPAVARSFTLGEAGVKQVLSQVVTEALNNLPQEQGEKTFMMTLNPETLGRITVKMVENAGKMNIVVTAHNKDTAELLSSRLDGMEAMMKQSGTQLEKCQVVYEPEQNDRAGQQNYEGSSKNPYSRQQDESGTDEDGKFAEALQQAV